MNFSVTQTGDGTIEVPWRLVANWHTSIAVLSSWNWTVESQTDVGQVAGLATADWQQLAPHQGNAVGVGVIVTNTGADFIPDAVTLNGMSCLLRAH